MAFPQGLFVEKPEMEDVSMNKLPNDADAWPEDIIQKLKERVPDVAGMATIVKFIKKDEESGTATGSISVSNESKSVTVPLIIKDFMMYPLDIFQAEGKLLPLTPDFFKSAFSDNETFAKLEEYPTFGGLGRFEDSSLWNATYPPSLGRYSYASAGYDILDAISDGIDGNSLKMALANDPASLMRFRKHGHAELIKKVANLHPVNMNENMQGAVNLIDRPIKMLKRDGANKYTILSNTDNYYDPMIVGSMTREDLKRVTVKVSPDVEDCINDVDSNGEKMLSVPSHSDKELAQPQAEIPEMANEYGHYSVKNKNGVNIEGVVIPTVIGFNMKRNDLKVFIGKTMGTVQAEIAGVRIQNSEFKPQVEPPKPGQTGVFVFYSEAKKALSTIPVTIESVTSDCGSMKLRVLDLLGVGYNLILSSSVDTFKSIAQNGDGTYTLPEKFRWVPIQGFDKVSNSPADYAAMGMGATKVASITVIDTQGHYSIRGVDKYANASGWDATFLEPHQAKFMMISLGCSEEKVASVFKEAKRYGSCKVDDINFIPIKREKVAEAKPLARSLVSQAEGFKSNLIKAASFMENSQTVDAMLSLNFVNPDNITKFVGKISSFKACISNLASCLVASRLGVKEIPENAVSTAMYRLIDVVNGLDALRATQENG